MAPELVVDKLRRGPALLLGCLALCYGEAGIGGAITSRSLGRWYEGLRKSRLNPPGWVFGPVWTALYTMMAVAGWLVARRSTGEGETGPDGRAALAAWGTQLGLNLAWSAV